VDHEPIPPDEPDDHDDHPSVGGGSGSGGVPFPFGPLGGGQFDPSTFDFSQVDLNQVMRMLQSDGPVNWEMARQTAESVAGEGRTDSPVSDPVSDADRRQFEELAHAAQTLVVGESGLTATFATDLRTVGPRGWVDLHLVVLRPVLESLATNLGDAMRRVGDEADAEDGDDALGAADFPAMPGMPGIPPGAIGAFGGLGPMLGMIAPVLLGVQAGSMIGFLAQHALGRYDLPLPTGPLPTTTKPGGDEPSLCFVVPNIDAFEKEWELPRDDLRFYVALHEVVHAALRSVPWIRSRLVQLAADYVSAYRVDVNAFEAEFGMVDPSDPASMQSMTEDPERVLGAMQSPEQAAPREELQRLTAVIDGYADHVLGVIGHRLIPTFDRIHEAKQRHRVERGEAERFIGALLGLELERAHYERGQAFVEGVVARAGLDGINRLFDSEAMLPTPSELDAPGLWLARIGVDAGDELDDLPELEIPDFPDFPEA
jgi:putative hydrolase